ncbi:hypothetical protein DFH07DRAFT_1033352 [Mycena maculata]|uniref:Uncharacterized protein n=1 Tax=Mycena maculata TaxID=230809 RepID=A0AAD7K5L3_9AGAR|nr:hypothetical protein DFH07DRAFT_1033352 [Mycena maculata]
MRDYRLKDFEIATLPYFKFENEYCPAVPGKSYMVAELDRLVYRKFATLNGVPWWGASISHFLREGRRLFEEDTIPPEGAQDLPHQSGRGAPRRELPHRPFGPWVSPVYENGQVIGWELNFQFDPEGNDDGFYDQFEMFHLYARVLSTFVKSQCGHITMTSSLTTMSKHQHSKGRKPGSISRRPRAARSRAVILSEAIAALYRKRGKSQWKKWVANPNNAWKDDLDIRYCHPADVMVSYLICVCFWIDLIAKRSVAVLLLPPIAQKGNKICSWNLLTVCNMIGEPINFKFVNRTKRPRNWSFDMRLTPLHQQNTLHRGASAPKRTLADRNDGGTKDTWYQIYLDSPDDSGISPDAVIPPTGREEKTNDATASLEVEPSAPRHIHRQGRRTDITSKFHPQFSTQLAHTTMPFFVQCFQINVHGGRFEEINGNVTKNITVSIGQGTPRARDESNAQVAGRSGRGRRMDPNVRNGQYDRQRNDGGKDQTRGAEIQAIARRDHGMAQDYKAPTKALPDPTRISAADQISAQIRGRDSKNSKPVPAAPAPSQPIIHEASPGPGQSHPAGGKLSVPQKAPQKRSASAHNESGAGRT